MDRLPDPNLCSGKFNLINLTQCSIFVFFQNNIILLDI